MRKGIWAATSMLGVALGLLAVPAAAAPAIGSGAGGLRAALSETTNVDQVRWYSRCWRDRWGHRRCRRVWSEGPYYGYEPYYGPGMGFYFGGGRGHHFRGHGFRGGHGHRR